MSSELTIQNQRFAWAVSATMLVGLWLITFLFGSSLNAPEDLLSQTVELLGFATLVALSIAATVWCIFLLPAKMVLSNEITYRTICWTSEIPLSSISKLELMPIAGEHDDPITRMFGFESKLKITQTNGLSISTNITQKQHELVARYIDAYYKSHQPSSRISKSPLVRLGYLAFGVLLATMGAVLICLQFTGGFDLLLEKLMLRQKLLLSAFPTISLIVGVYTAYLSLKPTATA